MSATTYSPRLEILRNAPLNCWVALSEDESSVVAIGQTYSEVSEKSEDAGVENPVILKTPPSWAPLNL